MGEPFKAINAALKEAGRPTPELRQEFDALTASIRSSYPDADRQALLWLLQPHELKTQATYLGNAKSHVHAYYSEQVLVMVVRLWVVLRPLPEATQTLEAALKEYFLAVQQADPSAEGHNILIAYAYLAPEDDLHGLLRLLLQMGRLGLGIRTNRPESILTDHVCWLIELLSRRQALTAEEFAATVPLYPRAARWLNGHHDLPLVDRSAAIWSTQLRQPETASGALLAFHALSHKYSFAGIDLFLAICLWLDQNPKEKLPLDPTFDRTAASGAAFTLQRMQPPSPADIERAGELGQISPTTLLNAVLYAPTWGALIEQQIGWSGLADLVTWLARYGGSAPWADGYQEPELDVTRARLLELLPKLDEKQTATLFKHRLAKGLYRNGLYYLKTALGENTAEVEAGFLKRDKVAVVALGLLPDEGDILDRYLALRRFAKESKQFGAQRQGSEGVAVQEALANLAATAGYPDLGALEWAMEAQLAADLDPTRRRWEIGDYTLWIQPDEAATLIIERDGKHLKSVPPAIRQDPQYEEIKEAREALKEQFIRVRARLEQAMITGEVMDQQTFSPALTTPAGRAMLPGLVLRAWRSGAVEPIELLNFQTFDGETIQPGELDRFQIAHPLNLTHPWRERLPSQPFNQLFRETYKAVASGQIAGRQVRLGTFGERMKRRGWELGHEGFLRNRRLPREAEATLWFEDGAAYEGALEVRTLAAPELRGSELIISEMIRDIDLASTAAAPDKATAPISPEVLTARANLLIALAPGAERQGDQLLYNGYRFDLLSGTVLDPGGAPLDPPKKAPTTFPYPNPDATLAELAAAVSLVARQHR